MKHRTAKLVETISYKNHCINMYSIPFMYPGSNLIHCATITTEAGYVKKIMPWFTHYATVRDAAKEYISYNL